MRHAFHAGPLTYEPSWEDKSGVVVPGHREGDSCLRSQEDALSCRLKASTTETDDDGSCARLRYTSPGIPSLAPVPQLLLASSHGDVMAYTIKFSSGTSEYSGAGVHSHKSLEMEHPKNKLTKKLATLNSPSTVQYILFSLSFRLRCLEIFCGFGHVT